MQGFCALRDLFTSCGFGPQLVIDPAHCPSLWAAECAGSDPLEDAEYQLVDFVVVADKVGCQCQRQCVVGGGMQAGAAAYWLCRGC